MRVEKLLGHLHLDGISTEIRGLAETLPREDVAVEMARRIARDPRRGATVEARLDAGLRVGLAILTEGILVAPLEGLAEVHLRTDRAGAGYVELFFAGPIRAAGGTAQALSVLLADVLRRDLGLSAYRPEEAEIGRYQEEIPLYKHLQHLQYVPSAEEIDLVARHVPGLHLGRVDRGGRGGQRVPEPPEGTDERDPRRRVPRHRGGALPEGAEAPQDRREARGPRLGVPREARPPEGRRDRGRPRAQVPHRSDRRPADPLLPPPRRGLPARLRPRPHRGSRCVRDEPRDDGGPPELRRRRDPGQARVPGEGDGDGALRRDRGPDRGAGQWRARRGPRRGAREGAPAADPARSSTSARSSCRSASSSRTTGPWCRAPTRWTGTGRSCAPTGLPHPRPPAPASYEDALATAHQFDVPLPPRVPPLLARSHVRGDRRPRPVRRALGPLGGRPPARSLGVRVEGAPRAPRLAPRAGRRPRPGGRAPRLRRARGGPRARRRREPARPARADRASGERPARAGRPLGGRDGPRPGSVPDRGARRAGRRRPVFAR